MISALRALLYFSIRATIRGVCSRLRNHNIDTTLGNQSYTATHYLTVACVRTRRKEKTWANVWTKPTRGSDRLVRDPSSMRSLEAHRTREIFFFRRTGISMTRDFYACFSSNIINSYYHHCRKVLFLKKFNFFFGAEVANAGEWERARHVRQIFFCLISIFFFLSFPPRRFSSCMKNPRRCQNWSWKNFERRNGGMMWWWRLFDGAPEPHTHSSTHVHGHLNKLSIANLSSSPLAAIFCFSFPIQPFVSRTQ